MPFYDIEFSRSKLKNSAEEKILGITTDNKLNFKSNIINMYIVANQKLSVLQNFKLYRLR